MAGEGQPSTSFAGSPQQDVDGRVKPGHDAQSADPGHDAEESTPGHDAEEPTPAPDTVRAESGPGTDPAAPGDDTEDEPETGPLRRCILTRERLPKERMIRFVVGPGREIVPDLNAKLPGRGIWLSAAGDVLETASAKGNLTRAFARAARGPVVVPPDLLAVLQAALIRRISELLGLSRRAGQAVAGFDKAREWLRGGRARLVVQASDGSEAERLRLLSGARLPVFTPLPGAALGRVFGRDYVVHVAIAPGKLAESLCTDAERLAGLIRKGQNAAPRNEATGANG